MDSLITALEGGDQSAFEQLMQALISKDNAARREAESFYQDMLEHKPEVIVKFLCAGLASQSSNMKHFCCVYLRKAVRGDNVWEGCSPEVKDMVKQHGMKCLSEEKNGAIMHMLADTMSEVTHQTWNGPDKWVGVLQHMQTFIESQDAHLTEVALVLFSKLTEWLGQDSVLQSMQRQMYDVLFTCLQSSTMNVRLAACKATCNFIMSFDDEDTILSLKNLIAPTMDVLAAVLQEAKEVEARDILIDLATIAEREPRLFKPNFSKHAAVLLKVASNGDGSSDFDPETRKAAVEVVVSIVEERSQMIRKDAALVAMLCSALMGMLLDVEDTQGWHIAIDEQDLDDGREELHEYALQGLDRIAKPIGGKFLMAALWPMISEWASSQEWTKRQAALCAIAQTAEGCRKVLLPDQPLAELMRVCYGASIDSHAVVKWSACQAIGQVCTDLAAKIQKKHHGVIVKALLHLMGPQEEARVQAHAASAIVNFCEHADGNIVGLYLKALTDRFIVLLTSPNVLVVEGALTAIASVADSAEELFKPYYATIMPLLKQILSASKEKAHRRLCGKALECISLIGLNVGKEMFMPDAHEFLQVLQQLNAVEFEADDKILTYVQSAGTRMCKCLGTDFVQMLPSFVPPLLRAAGLKLKMDTIDSDDIDEADDDSYCYISAGDKTIRINTAGSEEKLNALNMLVNYAENLKEHFAPYCMELAKIVETVMPVPLLNNEDTRSACASLVPSLLNDVQLARDNSAYAQHATDAAIQEIFAKLMKALLKTMDTEVDLEVQHALYTAMEEVVDYADQALLTPEVLTESFKRITDQSQALLVSASDRKAHKGTQELDEEDMEELEEMEEAEDEVLQQIITAIGTFLKRMGDTAAPIVQELLASQFQPLLTEPSRSEHERWLALMVISDLIEHAPSSSSIVPLLMPRFIEYSTAQTKELVNISVYTLGIVAEKHPQEYAQHHQVVLDVLCKVIDTTAGIEDWEYVRDNAVASLGRILAAHENLTSGAIGLQLGKKWLDCLPLTADEVEAGKQHEQLHQFLLKNDARILGENHSNLMKIAEIFVRVIGKGDQLLEEGNVNAFTAFFAQQLRPVLEQHGCNLQQAAQNLEPQDRQRFADALQAVGS